MLLAARPEFVTSVLHALLQTFVTRIVKLLILRGVLVEGTGQTYLAEETPENNAASS